MTLTSVPAGTYRIAWSYEWYYDNANNNFVARVQLDDATDLANHVQEPKDGSTSQRMSYSGFTHVALTAATHTIDIDFAAGSAGDVAGILNARIEAWRVS